MTPGEVWDGVRALRLAAFAVTATGLALGAHLAAGGAPPAAGPAAVAFVLPAYAGWALSRRRRGAVELLVVLAAVQVAMHEVFTATADPCPLGSSGPGMAGQQLAGNGGWIAMSAGHALAVLLTALLLAQGERALHGLVPLLDQWWRRARLLLPRVGSAVLHREPIPAIPPGPVRRPLGQRVMASVLVRRGPPARVVTRLRPASGPLSPGVPHRPPRLASAACRRPERTH